MHGTSEFVKFFFIFGVKKWTRRLGAEDGERTPGVHIATRVFLCRSESYFPSDIHLGGVTLSVMLYTSLYVQCYFNKAKQNLKKKKKPKKNLAGQTRSISILTYDMTLSDENFQNFVST